VVATLRPPRPDEATAIAAAINEHSQIVNEADSVTPDVVSYWFTIPELDPEYDVLVAEAPSGKLVGYADVNNGGTSKTRFWIDLHLLPDAGAEVGDALVEALERRARERAEVGAVVRGISLSATISHAGCSLRAATSSCGTR
jgi:acetylornithine deacetylase/succinyl-diaminopimelate desuccinylase-like protein